MKLCQGMIVIWSVLVLASSSSWAQSIVAAVLPSSRSVQMGTPATAFATIINAGSTTATACGISPITSIPATFTFQTTDPATNQITGSPNTVVDIAASAAQSFVIALTPTAPVAPTDVQFSFHCSNTNPASITSGLNTLLFSASTTPVPDVIALAATLTRNGVVSVSNNLVGPAGTGVFSVATANVGSGGTITVSADTDSSSSPVALLACATNPATGACLANPAPTVTTQINGGATSTFGIFVVRNGPIVFDPAARRIFVRFKDGSGVTRGSTSVAVAPGNTFLPVFSHKPFDGDMPVGNFLDHDVPKEFVDMNGIQVTWWGERANFFDGHQGYDFPMPEGTLIRAVADGQVMFAGVTSPFFCPVLNLTVTTTIVSVDHQAPNGERIRSIYNHLSRADVQVGDSVQAGQQVGLSGNTGCSTGPHLHFEVSRQTNTNSRQPTIIDPFGWDSPVSDPWAQHPQGAESLYLWLPSQAPALYKEGSLAPNCGTPTCGSGSVTITRWRYMGLHDDLNPNNEFVELTVDPRFAAGGLVNLIGFKLQNRRGDSYTLPSGFVIHDGQPILVHSGPGVNTQTDLFWGLDHGVWDNTAECIKLVYPTGGIYRIATAGGACN
jgi:Peptidase family M23